MPLLDARRVAAVIAGVQQQQQQVQVHGGEAVQVDERTAWSAVAALLQRVFMSPSAPAGADEVRAVVRLATSVTVYGARRVAVAGREPLPSPIVSLIAVSLTRAHALASLLYATLMQQEQQQEHHADFCRWFQRRAWARGAIELADALAQPRQCRASAETTELVRQCAWSVVEAVHRAGGFFEATPIVRGAVLARTACAACMAAAQQARRHCNSISSNSSSRCSLSFIQRNVAIAIRAVRGDSNEGDSNEDDTNDDDTNDDDSNDDDSNDDDALAAAGEVLSGLLEVVDLHLAQGAAAAAAAKGLLDDAVSIVQGMIRRIIVGGGRRCGGGGGVGVGVGRRGVGGDTEGRRRHLFALSLGATKAAFQLVARMTQGRGRHHPETGHVVLQQRLLEIGLFAWRLCAIVVSSCDHCGDDVGGGLGVGGGVSGFVGVGGDTGMWLTLGAVAFQAMANTDTDADTVMNTGTTNTAISLAAAVSGIDAAVRTVNGAILAGPWDRAVKLRDALDALTCPAVDALASVIVSNAADAAAVSNTDERTKIAVRTLLLYLHATAAAVAISSVPESEESPLSMPLPLPLPGATAARLATWAVRMLRTGGAFDAILLLFVPGEIDCAEDNRDQDEEASALAALGHVLWVLRIVLTTQQQQQQQQQQHAVREDDDVMQACDLSASRLIHACLLPGQRLERVVANLRCSVVGAFVDMLATPNTPSDEDKHNDEEHNDDDSSVAALVGARLQRLLSSSGSSGTWSAMMACGNPGCPLLWHGDAFMLVRRLMPCGGGCGARYCSRECQAVAWAQHRHAASCRRSL